MDLVEAASGGLRVLRAAALIAQADESIVADVRDLGPENIRSRANQEIVPLRWRTDGCIFRYRHYCRPSLNAIISQPPRGRYVI